MADLPVFTPRPCPTMKLGRKVIFDENARPRCRLCPEAGPVDDPTGLGLHCWRFLTFVRVALEAHFAGRGKP